MHVPWSIHGTYARTWWACADNYMLDSYYSNIRREYFFSSGVTLAYTPTAVGMLLIKLLFSLHARFIILYYSGHFILL